MGVDRWRWVSPPSNAKPELLRFVVTARRAILAKLVSGVMRGTPLLALTGPRGAGKTTMASAIQEVLVRKSVRVLRVGLAELSGIPLRVAICQLRDGAGADCLAGDVDRTSGVATTRSASDLRFVAIIDDAHLLPPDALEHLRLLIGGAMGAMPQMVFVGDPSFWDTMQDRSRADLRDLITDRCELELLSADETRALAALSGSTCGFGEGALDALARHGHGLIGRTIALVSATEAARGERQPPMLTAAGVAAAAAWLDAGGVGVTSDADLAPQADHADTQMPMWAALADADTAEATSPSRPRPRLGFAHALGTTALLFIMSVVAYCQMSLHGEPVGAQAGPVPATEIATVTSPSVADMPATVSDAPAAPRETLVTLLPAEPQVVTTDTPSDPDVAPADAGKQQPEAMLAAYVASDNLAIGPAVLQIAQQQPPAPEAPSDSAGTAPAAVTPSPPVQGVQPSLEQPDAEGVVPPAPAGDPAANMDRTAVVPDTPAPSVITGPVAAPSRQVSEPDPVGEFASDRPAAGEVAVPSPVAEDAQDAPTLPVITQPREATADAPEPPQIDQQIAAPKHPSAETSDSGGGPAPQPAVAVASPASSGMEAPSAAASGSPRYQAPNLVFLLTRGDAMLALGDISAARLLYERAASLGSARAATSLGKTYDPDFLATIRASGIIPNRDTAAAWYRKAAALGDADGADRQARSLPR